MEFTYTEDLLTAVTNLNGDTTPYEYDEKGNVSKVTDPLGFTKMYEYDERGNVVKYTDVNNEITSQF